jgi:flagellar biosynthetic protein FliO
MPKPKGIFFTLLEKFKKWPKWLQYTLGSFVTIMAVILLLTGGPSKSAGDISDPFGNSFAILVDIILKLGLVVILIFISALVYRRWRPGGPSGNLHQLGLLETLSLGPKRTLYIVKAGDQQLLIGATDQSISLISELAPIADSASLSSQTPSSQPPDLTGQPAFSDLLALSIDKSKDPDR